MSYTDLYNNNRGYNGHRRDYDCFANYHADINAAPANRGPSAFGTFFKVLMVGFFIMAVVAGLGKEETASFFSSPSKIMTSAKGKVAEAVAPAKTEKAEAAAPEKSEREKLVEKALVSATAEYNKRTGNTPEKVVVLDRGRLEGHNEGANPYSDYEELSSK